MVQEGGNGAKRTRPKRGHTGPMFPPFELTNLTNPLPLLIPPPGRDQQAAREERKHSAKQTRWNGYPRGAGTLGGPDDFNILGKRSLGGTALSFWERYVILPSLMWALPTYDRAPRWLPEGGPGSPGEPKFLGDDATPRVQRATVTVSLTRSHDPIRSKGQRHVGSITFNLQP